VTTEREAQTALGEIALQLVAIEDRLTRLGDSLPAPPNQEDMLEHRVPYDVATELAGMIACVVSDEIRPAIEYLEKAARVTAEDLVREFGERWRGWNP
jgi:hypothetical protein